MADNVYETGETTQAIDMTQAVCHACPHLGHDDDRLSYSCYADERNSCFRFGQAEAIGAEQQANYCLCAGHTRCPIFQQQAVKTTPKPTLSLGKLIFGFLSSH
ncbi:MAG: hypothetical protein KC443_10880 [Anaerolineales bacterium]|nr:hypothetical protein [Anaerolineales bacterium]MCB8967290.1 hypothetical protein [Ardenticatenaceae bacterium]